MMQREPMSPNNTEFDVVGFCLAYESGDLSESEVVAGFQRLIDSGLAYQLQGHYGRTAERLITSGKCKPKTTTAREP